MYSISIKTRSWLNFCCQRINISNNRPLVDYWIIEDNTVHIPISTVLGSSVLFWTSCESLPKHCFPKRAIGSITLNTFLYLQITYLRYCQDYQRQFRILSIYKQQHQKAQFLIFLENLGSEGLTPPHKFGKSTWEAERPALSLWFVHERQLCLVAQYFDWRLYCVHFKFLSTTTDMYGGSQRGRTYLCNYLDSYGWRQIGSIVCWSLDSENNSQFGSYIGISPYVSCKGYRRIKCLCPYWEIQSENFGLNHFDLKCLPCVSQILIFS